MTDYSGNDNYGKPKKIYVDSLAELTDDELLSKTKDAIWFSAYASNNPRSDYHWQCDACYDECKRRGKPTIYKDAYDYHAKS